MPQASGVKEFALVCPGKSKGKVCWSQRVLGFQATLIALMSSPKPLPLPPLLGVLLLVALFATPAAAWQKKYELPRLGKKTEDMEKREGFFTFYLDRQRGKVWLEIPPPSGERREAAQLLYVEGLLTGLGSNPVGLDRGQIGAPKLLTIRRVGPRVLFEQPNLRYRALSDDPAERRARAQSFATSVVWAATIAALDPDGRSLVDFTPFLIRDAHGISARLRETDQGSFELDPDRSAVDFEACLAFPDNVELEALVTFAGTEPGGHVRATAPTPESVSLVQHHSLIRLPDDGYRPRRADPRIGVFGIEFLDYAAGLDEPLRQRWVARHRLQKTDPAAPRSRVGEPLVFYVDPGAPEPVRSALVEGASWWAEAFEQAGLIDAYRVELLPEGAHPLDVRYNLIQWVHRSTRGWSYGNAVMDPRTGEIIKGHVSLGSLRVRQDRLLFEGLAGTERTGSGGVDDPLELALARIRQLAAHEVGHALGLAHNFAASTYDGRASVMDYPAPLVRVNDDGELDFSRAYGVGVGSWDLATIRYAYAELPPGTDEEAALTEMVREGLEVGHLYLSDRDARSPGAADPRANLWDNGDDPVVALELALRVRQIALERFGERNIMPGRPLAELREVLAPLYFHHRFQLDAAVKVVGGMEYRYALRGDGQTPLAVVDGERQRRALQALLEVLTPAQLDLPDSVLDLLVPWPYEPPRPEEMIDSATWPAFDALGAAATVADGVVAALLQPERLGRLLDFHRRTPALPGVGEVLDGLLRRAFSEPAGEPRHAAIERVVERVVIDRLIGVAGSPEVRPEIRAEIEWALRIARDRLRERVPEAADATRTPASFDAELAHAVALVADVTRFLDREATATDAIAHPAPPPPGSPIGALAGCGFGHGMHAQEER
ncbi:MAG: DUF5117 domain-containing protein [bacterium]|nr:DUF5117 domain-containing protein [bacterium]